MPVLQGQVSRDDVAALCVELLEQPAALNTTFEVCSSGSAGEQQDLKVPSSATQTKMERCGPALFQSGPYGVF